jgi:ABC-type glycerol-3-phosphate transport system substrate-binding protein
VLAIVTPDPARQRAAAELITWLLKPENAGAWAESANWLPTSSDALEALGSGPYWDFLDAQLVQARGMPVGPDYAATAGRIQSAIEAVVRGQSDAATATDAAINGQP